MWIQAGLVVGKPGSPPVDPVMFLDATWCPLRKRREHEPCRLVSSGVVWRSRTARNWARSGRAPLHVFMRCRVPTGQVSTRSREREGPGQKAKQSQRAGGMCGGMEAGTRRQKRERWRRKEKRGKRRAEGITERDEERERERVREGDRGRERERGRR